MLTMYPFTSTACARAAVYAAPLSASLCVASALSLSLWRRFTLSGRWEAPGEAAGKMLSAAIVIYEKWRRQGGGDRNSRGRGGHTEKRVAHVGVWGSSCACDRLELHPSSLHLSVRARLHTLTPPPPPPVSQAHTG